MAFETRDWAPLLNRSITVYPFASEDSAGKRTYGTPRTIACRITDDVRTWRFKNSDERQSIAMVWFSDSAVTSSDKILMPAGYEPQEVAIIWLRRQDDEQGYHHSEVYV